MGISLLLLTRLPRSIPSKKNTAAINGADMMPPFPLLSPGISMKCAGPREGKRYFFPRIEAFDPPVVVVQGMKDDVVLPQDVSDWFQTIETSKTWVQIDDAEHFFHGQLVALKQSLLDTLAPLVAESS